MSENLMKFCFATTPCRIIVFSQTYMISKLNLEEIYCGINQTNGATLSNHCFNMKYAK